METLPTTVLDTLDEILDSDDMDVETAVSRIPSMFGSSLKATYFGLRSLGLNPTQVAKALNMEEGTIQHWKNTDKNFIEFEQQALPLLQKNSGIQIVRLAFLRNMTMFIMKDAHIIGKSLEEGPESLTDREFKYLLQLRKHYTPSDLLAIEKAVNPEAHNGKVEINLTWGNGNTIIDGDGTFADEPIPGEYYELAGATSR